MLTSANDNAKNVLAVNGNDSTELSICLYKHVTHGS